MQSRSNALLSVGAMAVISSLSSLFDLLVLLIFGIVSLTTLRQGATEGLAVLASALLAKLVAESWLHQGNLLSFYQFCVGLLPVYLLAQALRITNSLEQMLYVGVWVGSLLVMGIYLLVDDFVSWRQNLFSQLFPGYDPLEYGDQFASLGFLVAVFYLVYWVVGNLLGRWLQSITVHPGGFGQEFRALTASRYLAVLTLICLALYVSQTGEIQLLALDIMLLLMVTYWLFGIALVHFIVKQINLHRSVFILVYLLNLVPPMQLIIAGAGFLDTWFNFRKSFTNTSKDD